MATRDEFVEFIRDVMGIDETELPDNSPQITTAYNLSLSLNQSSESLYHSAIEFDTAVYNLGGHFLIEIGTTPSLLTFQSNFNVQSLGILTSAGNDATSSGKALPKWFTESGDALTSQLAKTPFGRTFLAINSQLQSHLYSTGGGHGI